MRLMVLSKKLVGKILAMPIYTHIGTTLLNKGSMLTEGAIEKIQNRGIATVYIEDDSCEIELQEMLDSKIKLKAIFDIKVLFDEAEKNRKLNTVLAENIVKNIMENINLSENAFLYNNVSFGKETGLELAMHSFEVLIYSLIVGLNRKYDAKKALNLGLGALLHDIGKVFGSGREHAILGYNFAKAQMDIPTTTYLCILQHHEYEDGSGFPKQLKGNNIYEFSKIVAMCNDYINLLHNQESHLPSQAIETMIARAVTKFDKDIFKTFINSIYCYPNGLEVKMDSGARGIVIRQNKELPTRPVVGVIRENTPILIDMTKELTASIEEIVW
ncbi:HD domain-containing protein [Clostridium swellfunianum]|uniref:HD-GYP domain-containing protein n=1 Tax=Clostridium swellfunianum TaxID=1367462 RepID=UPI00202E0B0D|nr:HD domain-containing phosphohydrolase [Clostridium swellfunianum]MCM0649080.1 HD domain-containing protein [Clostridium swellfunianum]